MICSISVLSLFKSNSQLQKGVFLEISKILRTKPLIIPLYSQAYITRISAQFLLIYEMCKYRYLWHTISIKVMPNIWNIHWCLRIRLAALWNSLKNMSGIWELVSFTYSKFFYLIRTALYRPSDKEVYIIHFTEVDWQPLWILFPVDSSRVQSARSMGWSVGFLSVFIQILGSLSFGLSVI